MYPILVIAQQYFWNTAALCPHGTKPKQMNLRTKKIPARKKETNGVLFGNREMLKPKCLNTDDWIHGAISSKNQSKNAISSKCVHGRNTYQTSLQAIGGILNTLKTTQEREREESTCFMTLPAEIERQKETRKRCRPQCTERGLSLIHI